MDEAAGSLGVTETQSYKNACASVENYIRDNYGTNSMKQALKEIDMFVRRLNCTAWSCTQRNSVTSGADQSHCSGSEAVGNSCNLYRGWCCNS